MRARAAACAAIGGCAVAAAVAPAAALAATVAVEPNAANPATGTAAFISTDLEINDLTITLDGTAYVFRDTASPVAAGAGCAPVDANAVRCDAATITELRVVLARGNDAATNTTATFVNMGGGDGDDVLRGGPGNEVFDGQGGVDIVEAGAGNDVIFDVIDGPGGDNPDRYSCGTGDDRVSADILDIVDPDCERVSRPAPPPGGGTPVPTPVPPGADPGPAAGPCGVDVLGTTAADSLTGDAARNRLFGLRGDDTLRGGAGDDCLRGGDGNDRASGQAGADIVRGDSGRDRLSGGSGADRVSGGSGADRLSGGSGSNVLDGGSGSDLILAANRVRDVVRCGRGRDTVRADRFDRLRGCERVTVRR